MHQLVTVSSFFLDVTMAVASHSQHGGKAMYKMGYMAVRLVSWARGGTFCACFRVCVGGLGSFTRIIDMLSRWVLSNLARCGLIRMSYELVPSKLVPGAAQPLTLASSPNFQEATVLNAALIWKSTLLNFLPSNKFPVHGIRCPCWCQSGG